MRDERMRKVTQKRKPFTSQRFRRAVVKYIPCVASGMPADDPHHIKNIGTGTGPKDDRLIIPLTREKHDLYHHDPAEWVRRHGTQIWHCRRVLARVKELGLLDKRPDLLEEAEQMLDRFERGENYEM